MIFSSALYFFFFVAVFFIHWAVLPLLMPEKYLRPARHTALLIASYVFFASYDWIYSFLLFFFTIVAYGSAFFLTPGSLKDRFRNWLLLGVICILVGLLCYYKYYNFFLGNLLEVLGFVGIKPDWFMHTIGLPLGISFFTFQALSYVIDVWRGKTAVEASFIRFGLFKSFFPQLVAGPIVTARDFIPQLYTDTELTVERLRNGARWFALGYFKKAVIADNVGPAVSAMLGDKGMYGTEGSWLGAFGFITQMYGDFSGYSDMAWGSAIWLGFHLPENFRMPHIARSISEHWRRWHMSLGRWIRDYLYISLGGNRVSWFRHKINLVIAMLVSGFWHGANWTFVVWGLIFGIWLAAETIFQEWYEKRPKLPDGPVMRLLRWPFEGLRWFYAMICVTTIHVLFSSPTVSYALFKMKLMYFYEAPKTPIPPSLYKPILTYFGIMMAGEWLGYWIWEKGKFQIKVPIWLEFAIYPFLALLLIQLAAPDGGAFIYFVF